MLIGENFKIESDEMNITLFKKKIITGTGRGRHPSKRAVGEEYWIPTNYFSCVKSALDFIVNNEINGTGLKEFKDVVAKVEELKGMIKTLAI